MSGGVLPAWVVALGFAATLGSVGVGELAEVRVARAMEAAHGVRLIEVSGTVAGTPRTLWVMITERHYAKLIGCKVGGGGPALQYSDRSLLVSAVTC